VKKIAVMADIHSNSEALRTCIHEARKRNVDEFIFLGDYIGDMASPQRTLELLKQIEEQYPCTFIRGNKENYWIDHRRNSDEVWESGKSSTGMLAYNYSQLSNSDINFFEKLPISDIMHYDGYPDITICHGSPSKVNQSMRPDCDYIDELMDEIPTDLVLCGHFHIQMNYKRKGKQIINPGAVGVPLHSEGKTQFMILHGNQGVWSPEFISLHYDRERVIKDMELEKLDIKAPGWYKITKHLLMTGEISHVTVVQKVMDLYFRESGKYDLDQIPENIWNRVIEELFSCK
jgi:putative phosphoesterase